MDHWMDPFPTTIFQFYSHWAPLFNHYTDARYFFSLQPKLRFCFRKNKSRSVRFPIQNGLSSQVKGKGGMRPNKGLPLGPWICHQIERCWRIADWHPVERESLCLFLNRIDMLQ